MMTALRLAENTIAENRSLPGAISSPRTATRKITYRISWRFKAVGFEALTNGVAKYQSSSGLERIPRKN